jgi:hypothetical protein
MIFELKKPMATDNKDFINTTINEYWEFIHSKKDIVNSGFQLQKQFSQFKPLGSGVILL